MIAFLKIHTINYVNELLIFFLRLIRRSIGALGFLWTATRGDSSKVSNDYGMVRGAQIGDRTDDNFR